MTEPETKGEKIDYDSMTPEEQKEHDRLVKEKEEAEQAGKHFTNLFYACHII